MKKGSAVWLFTFLLSVTASSPLYADQFSRERELSWKSVREDTRSFFSNIILGGVDENNDGEIAGLEETSNATIFRSTAAASILLGLICGLLGSFITLRRMALFGDMIGHAVLPGVAVGFILVGSKSTPALLIGAAVAGLLATALTRAIRTRSRIKEDAALGISLTLFYALGVWLLAWISRHPELSLEASGLSHYLFGNPAVILPEDLWALGFAAVLVLATVVFGFKELLVCAFDPSFSSSIGIPQSRIDPFLLVLLTVVVVVSIKILGVVLVAALLIIPPSTAYLLTDRFKTLCVLSAVLGAVSGISGVYLSLILHVDMGPTIICIAFAMLTAVFLLSPSHGVLARYLRYRSLRQRTLRENLLASAYRVRERDQSIGSEIPLAAIAEERRESESVVRDLAKRLRGSGWGEAKGAHLILTSTGAARAEYVVRVHRLWELFLSQEASLPDDHVHAGAEQIENHLNPETIEELERLLGMPESDPHGSTIPPSTTRSNDTTLSRVDQEGDT